MIATLLLALLPLAQVCEAIEPLTQFGRRYVLDQPLDPARLVHPVSENGSRYLRVRLRVDQPSTGSWLLTVRDSGHHPIQTFGPRDFSSSPVRWTARVAGSETLFSLERSEDSSVAITFEGYDAMPDQTPTPFYSIQVAGLEQWRPLYDTSDRATRHLGDFVGMLTASEPSAGATPLWTCSGVVVAPDLFLTNWHCGGLSGAKWRKEVLASMTIDLSWDDDTVSRDYAVVGLAADPSQELDFALLRIEPLGASGPLRPASLRAAPPVSGEALRLVHHPAALRKQLSVCRAGTVTASRIMHVCDSESGSSGAPLFDAAGSVVALHHHGFDRDSACRPTDKVNKAVRMDAILNAVRCADPALYARLRRK